MPRPSRGARVLRGLWALALGGTGAAGATPPPPVVQSPPAGVGASSAVQLPSPGTGASRAVPPPASAPRAVVRAAVAAVEADRVAAFRDSLRRAPSPLATLGLATLDRLTYRYAAADSGYRQLQGAAEPGVAGQAAVGLGLSLLARGALAEADGQLAPLAARPSPDQAEALAHLAMVRMRTAGARAADALLVQAAALAAREEAGLQALVRCQQALVRVQLGDPSVATLVREGVRLADAAGAPRVRGSCLLAEAQALERAGDVAAARALLGRLATLQRRLHHYHGLAATLQWDGYAALGSGAYAEARRLLDSALVMADRSGNATTAAWTHLNLAELAMRLREGPAAARHAARASEGFRTVGDRWGRMVATGLAGQSYLLAGNDSAAAPLLREALLRQAEVGSGGYTAETLRDLAVLARRRGDLAGADSLLRLGRTRAAAEGQRGWATELAYEAALVTLARGEAGAASRQLQAVLAALPRDEPGRRHDVQLRLAEALAADGDLEGAVRAVAEADAQADRWRGSLTDADLRLRWLQARRLDWDTDLGTAGLVARLLNADRPDEAFAIAERRRARALEARLLARRTEAGRPAPAAPPPTLEEVQARLPAGTALLAYVTDRNDGPTSTFLVTRGAVRTQVLDALAPMAPALDRFTGLVQSGAGAQRAAGTLGAALLPTALATLPDSVHRLVVVADGLLLRVPFDLLRLPGGTPLGTRFAITAAASAARAVAPAPPFTRAGRGSMVALGDPLLNGAMVPGDSMLPPLPGAQREAELARTFAGGQAFTGARASEATLRRVAGTPVAVLDIAAHAFSGQGTEDAQGIALAAGEGQDGFVDVRELAALRLDAGLVILSGCRTDDGALVDGEGIQGLATPLLESGARAVLATRWPVRDADAARVVELVLEQLEDGWPVGDAVARAKRIAADQSRTFDWAAFVLVGDGTLRLPLERTARLTPLLQLGLGALVLAAAAALGAYSARRRVSTRNGDAVSAPS